MRARVMGICYHRSQSSFCSQCAANAPSGRHSAQIKRLISRETMARYSTPNCDQPAPSLRIAVGMRNRSGWTLLEIVVCIAILVVLIGLFLPAVRTARGAARRMQCSNNLKQLALAALNYESTYKSLPAGWGGPARLVDSDYQPRYMAHEDQTQQLPPVGRWSAFVQLLPYLEQPLLYEQIQIEYRDKASESIYHSPISPWNSIDGKYQPWSTFLSALLCPADPASTPPRSPGPPEKTRDTEKHFFARTNYALNYGDCFLTAQDSDLPLISRGVFQGRVGVQLTDITDGLSNTLLFAEITTPSSSEIPDHNPRSIHGRVVAMNTLDLSTPSACRDIPIKQELPKGYISFAKDWRGIRWCDGAPAISGFTTCVAPNSTSCSINQEFSRGFYSASSHHERGITASMVDGSVCFISDLIDCGISDASVRELLIDSPSPFGAWGAMGTMQGSEIVADDTL